MIFLGQYHFLDFKLLVECLELFDELFDGPPARMAFRTFRTDCWLFPDFDELESSFDINANAAFFSFSMGASVGAN